MVGERRLWYFQIKHECPGEKIQHGNMARLEAPCAVEDTEHDENYIFRRVMMTASGPYYNDRYPSVHVREDVWKWLRARKDWAFWLESRYDTGGKWIAKIIFDDPKNAMLFKLTWL